MNNGGQKKYLRIQPKKIVQPEVKRVGLSAYLAAKQEEEAKSQEIIDKLTVQKNQRSLNTVINTGTNLNKKERDDVEGADTFFFSAPKTQKKTVKEVHNAPAPTNQIVFKMKKHHGFNMPRERKEGGEEGDNKGQRERGERGERGDNRGRYQGSKGERDNRPRPQKTKNPNNNKNKRAPLNKHTEFPPLGGKVAPRKDATWVGRSDDQ